MKKIFIVALLMICLALFIGCQKDKPASDTEVQATPASNTEVVNTEEKPADTEEATEETAKKPVTEKWAGKGMANYEMLLADFPVKIDWEIALKDVTMEVYEDNTLEISGKAIFSEELVKEVNLSETEKMAFIWDKLEYDFTLSGKKEGDGYILNKSQRTDGLMKSKGSSLNTAEYTVPIIFIGKEVKFTPSDNSIKIEHTEDGPLPKDVEEMSGNLTIELTKN